MTLKYILFLLIIMTGSLHAMGKKHLSPGSTSNIPTPPPDKQTLTSGIDNLLKRGEKLDEIIERSEDLAASSKRFLWESQRLSLWDKIKNTHYKTWLFEGCRGINHAIWVYWIASTLRSKNLFSHKIMFACNAAASFMIYMDTKKQFPQTFQDKVAYFTTNIATLSGFGCYYFLKK